MKNIARVIIAGCGDIGIGLGIKLVEQGHEVWGLRRNVNHVPPPIKPLAADLTKFETLENLPRGLDWIFIILTPDQFDDGSYKKAYVDSTRNLLRYLDERGETPERIFFASSTSVYAQSNGEWVDESSPTEPVSFSGCRMLEAEKILSDSPLLTTSVRFAGIYGPNRIRFINQLKNRKIGSLANQYAYRNLIHREDVIGILIHLMALPQPHPIYNGVDNNPVISTELMQWVATKLGVSVPDRVESQSVLSKRGKTNKRCSNERLVQSGYTFKYPSYQEGYGDIIDSF